MANTTSTTSENGATQPSQLEAVKTQVEFYFSQQNLANDAYLVSQMNAQMYVPIEVLLGFAKIKELTDDAKVIVEAVRNSKICTLSGKEDAIKPNIKTERNTIILREISAGTKKEEIETIFQDIGKQVKNIRSDVGDTWFVTMESEQEAVDTLLALRSKKFKDAPIKARLKSENILKSFYPPQSVDSTAPITAKTAPSLAGPAPAGTSPYGAPAPGAGYYGNYYGVPNNFGVQYNVGGHYAPADNSRYGNRRNFRGGRGNHYNNHQGKDHRSKSGSFERPNNRKNKDKKKQSDNSKKGSNHGERQPILNAVNFPPLPSASEEGASGSNSEIEHKYSHEDLMEIIKNMSDSELVLPEGKMDYAAHPAALTPDAHPDLLRNQRTYSIEQARESLRHGRPIRSDSVGSVDYESMMYGEEYTKVAREQRKKKEGDSEPKAAPKGKQEKKHEKSSSTDSKVAGYAAALIHGSPSPAPVSSPASSSSSTPAPAPTNGSSATASKVKGSKGQKGGEKKASAKKNGKGQPEKKAAAPKQESEGKVEEPTSAPSPWGGRSFLDVVKTQSDEKSEEVSDENKSEEAGSAKKEEGAQDN